jgi:hypothetical protein
VAKTEPTYAKTRSAPQHGARIGAHWTRSCLSAKILRERHSQMKKLVAVLYTAFPVVLLMGQTLSPVGGAVSVTTKLGTPSMDRLESLSKRFPPGLVSSTTDRDVAKPSHSYCVCPSLDTKSLSIKRCQPNPHELRLVSPYEGVPPNTKPAIQPRDMR